MKIKSRPEPSKADVPPKPDTSIVPTTVKGNYPSLQEVIEFAQTPRGTGLKGVPEPQRGMKLPREKPEGSIMSTDRSRGTPHTMGGGVDFTACVLVAAILMLLAVLILWSI